MTENDLNSICCEFNSYAREIVGRETLAVASFEIEDEKTHFIVLSYGNKHFRIRTDGYSAMYILSQLYHNEVTEAILK